MAIHDLLAAEAMITVPSAYWGAVINNRNSRRH